MREHRTAFNLTQLVTLAILALMFLGGCASTAVGKAVQSAEGAKIGVESAADEVIRIHERKQLSDADYLKAKAAYESWAAAQRAYTEALIAWTRNKTAAADATLQAKLTSLGPTLEAAADALCSFKAKSAQLTTICASIGR